MIGKFVTIEGCEGVGKSTQIKLLKSYCESNGIDAVFTREPGGTPVAEKIRDIILSVTDEKIDDTTELLLYCASRSRHTSEVILPALNQGKIVFCDRYSDSTLAYQGYARGYDKETIRKLSKIAQGDAEIDLTLFINLNPRDGFLRKGGADGDRLESEGLKFHEKVYEGFIDILKNEPSRVKAVDGQKSAQDVHKDIIGILKSSGIF